MILTQQEKWDLMDRITDVLQQACDHVCKYKSEYKDPDDLERLQCQHCKVWELNDKLQEDIDDGNI